MNHERLAALADVIEVHADKFRYDQFVFNAEEYSHETYGDIGALNRCGTSGCIAGWAAWMAKQEDLPYDESAHVVDVAQKYLELTDAERQHLFYAGPWVPDGADGGDLFYDDEEAYETPVEEIVKYIRRHAESRAETLDRFA